MNGFSAYWRHDGGDADGALVSSLAFRSAEWDPDHAGLWHEGPAGLHCVQRYVSPQEAGAPMPRVHPDSGCVVAANAHLTEREGLAATLGLSPNVADCDLILAAWLKWGRDCVRRIRGKYAFVIWDSRARRMFAAVDPLGLSPLYMARCPGKWVALANTMEPFRRLIPAPTLNRNLFRRYALDALPPDETCYEEVSKIPAGHCLEILPDRIVKTRYWTLKGSRRDVRGSRGELYALVAETFRQAVKDCLRTDFPVISQLSGGLDSSAVSGMAARLQADSGRDLHAFTAAPLALEGPSFRRNWDYHQLHLAGAVARQFPNIHHIVFRTDPHGDPLRDQEVFSRLADSPCRNVPNMHWGVAAYRHALAVGGRVMLNGDWGNATISWWGQTSRNRLRVARDAVVGWLRPEKMFGDYFSRHNPSLMKSASARKALREGWIHLDTHAWLLAHESNSANAANANHPSLWFGVESLDPTVDLRLVELVYSLPNRMFLRGPRAAERRLLAREALADVVPEVVRRNTRAGEQAADWHLQYNAHREAWRTRLRNLPPRAAEITWDSYDRAAILDLFRVYDRVEAPGEASHEDIALNLMRCLSMAFFLEGLEETGS